MVRVVDGDGGGAGGDREVLLAWTRASSVRAGLAQRARIVLLAADDVGTGEMVRRVGVSKPKVIAWKRRYAMEGLAGLDTRSKPGRPQVIDEAQIMVATLKKPPDRLGVTRWSSRLLAPELGLSNVTIAKVWRTWQLQLQLQLWRSETFTFSTDPELDAKVRDVSGCTSTRRTRRWCCARTFSVYRALDRDLQESAQFRAKGRLPIPVLAVGGQEALGAAVGNQWKEYATRVDVQVLPGSGHWVTEERPALLTPPTGGLPRTASTARRRT